MIFKRVIINYLSFTLIDLSFHCSKRYNWHLMEFVYSTSNFLLPIVGVYWTCSRPCYFCKWFHSWLLHGNVSLKQLILIRSLKLLQLAESYISRKCLAVQLKWNEFACAPKSTSSFHYIQTLRLIYFILLSSCYYSLFKFKNSTN